MYNLSLQDLRTFLQKLRQMRDYACYTRRSWKNKRVRYLFILESGHNCRVDELPPQFLGCGIKDMIFRVAALSVRRLNYISLNYMRQTVY